MESLALYAFLVTFSAEICLGYNDIRPSTIVRIARRYAKESSRQFLWSTEMPEMMAPGQTDKSHLFVAHVLQEAGIPAPKRNYLSGIPIGAMEWANPNSYIFRMTNCWKRCSGAMQIGDVISMDNHVAIFTSYRGSTSPANDQSMPLGVVKESRWGFRPGDKPFCRRFRYENSLTCFHY